jgi:hypothetical protein
VLPAWCLRSKCYRSGGRCLIKVLPSESPSSSLVALTARPVGELPYATKGLVDLRAERDRVEGTVRRSERLLLRLGEDAGGQQAL